MFIIVAKTKIVKKMLILISCCIFLAYLAWNIGGWFQEKTVTVLSWAVANKVIVIDPGHGGPDPGAVGRNGTLEKDVTLSVALKLSEYLSKSGAMVVMTRSEDKDLGTSNNLRQRKKEDLSKRAQIVTDHGAKLYINLQVNSFRGKSRAVGAQTFYYSANEQGKVLSMHVQNELRRIMQNTNRQPLPLDVFMLRNVTIPGTLIEIGFLSNRDEENLLKDKNYQNKIAYAIFSGIVRYFSDEKVTVVQAEMK